MTFSKNNHTPDNTSAKQEGVLLPHKLGSRDDEKKICYDVSPHLLDLQWQTEDESRAEAIRRASARNKQKKSQLAIMLDERIHLRDIHARQLSLHPRGWKDFPPKSAKTIGEAISITAERFLHEHPLAELSIFAAFHLAILLVHRLFTAPLKAPAQAHVAQEDPLAGTGLESFPAFMLPVVDIPEMPTAAPATTSWNLLGVELDKQIGWQKSLAGFAMASLIVVLPLGAYSAVNSLQMSKTVVLEESMLGVELLRSAATAVQSHNFAAAHEQFSEAADHFDSAKSRLGSLGNAITYAASLVPSNHPATIAQPLLTAGREAAIGGAMMTRGLNSLENSKNPLEKLQALNAHLETAVPHLVNAAEAFERVSPSALPEEYAHYAVTANDRLPEVFTALEQFITASALLETILGSEEQKRYLVIFQNDRELRATGGFIGSFALMDINKGKVENLEIPGGGSYDLQGSLTERIVSPKPLHLINPHWEFQDANWSPNFPTSAQQLRHFYEKSGGPTTDGVIAINATMLETLLGVLGQVEMPEYDKTINQENFYIETQTEVEIDYNKDLNQPKKFISDLAPRILQQALDADSEKMLEVAQILHGALGTKEMQVWFSNEELQSEANSLGWTGEVAHTDGDYLYVVHTNIAGQKTDGVMNESIGHEVQILGDGTGIVTLTIERTHNGVKGDLFSGVRNVDYLRVFTPLGSTLIEAHGFDIPDPRLVKIPDADYVLDPTLAEQEAGMITDRSSGTHSYTDSGKTVFGNWVQTDPSETSIVTLVYRLPDHIIRVREASDEGLDGLYDKYISSDGQTLTYSLLVQKQAGAKTPHFTSRMNVPRGYFPIWETDERTADDRERLILTKDLTDDSFFSTIVQTR